MNVYVCVYVCGFECMARECAGFKVVLLRYDLFLEGFGLPKKSVGQHKLVVKCGKCEAGGCRYLLHVRKIISFVTNNFLMSKIQNSDAELFWFPSYF